MNWRDPNDEFGQRLLGAFQAVVSGPEKVSSLSPLEVILADLYEKYDTDRVSRLEWMGDELDESLSETPRKVHPEVAHFVERVRELVFDPSEHTTNVGEMLVWVREILSKEGDGAP